VRTGAALVAAFVALAHAPQGTAKPPRWWVRQARCVHRYEGPWNANTGNGYYGGMQMDKRFARTYGGWIVRHHGLPHAWRPATQLLVAYRGWLARGWYPWPNTARICGLI
jgi:resuscitation-promoting factor RpfA